MLRLVLISAATFALVFGIIAGSYWIFVASPERSARRTVRRRLAGASQRKKAGAIDIQRNADKLSAIPLLQKLLSRRGAMTVPMKQLIEQSGVRITLGAFLLLSACSVLGGFLLVNFLTRSSVGAVVAGALAGMMPFAYVRWARDRRIGRFEEYFPEALDLITRALRAGHAFTTGLAMVADEMPDPIGTEFRLLYDRQNYGAPIEEALKSFAERVPLLDAKFFVTAVLTQREAGGNLSEVLENLASVIRDRFTVKRQVRVKSAHGRLTGWILAGTPPALALALFIVSPDHVSLLATDPMGVRMVIVAIALQVVGTLLIRKIVNIEY